MKTNPGWRPHEGPDSGEGRRMKQKAPHLLLAGLAAVALPLLVYACTPERQHEWLTFFFDGVPPLHPPEKKETKEARKGETRPGTELAQAAPIVWSEHKPAQDTARCGACHDRDASYALLRPAQGLCLQCHQAQARQFPLMHGPVAVGDCSQCHEAHRSPYPHLAKAPPQQLCFRCHDRTLPGGRTLGCTRTSDDVDCASCHNPHGGTDRCFLRGRPPGTK